MHSYYSILICDCFCPFLSIFFKSASATQDRTGQWYQHLLTLFAIFYESNTEGTNFRIILCFTFAYNMNVLQFIPLVQDLI